MGSMVTSGRLGDVIISTMAKNARGVGSIPALATIFPIFITPTTILTYKECHDAVTEVPPAGLGTHFVYKSRSLQAENGSDARWGCIFTPPL